MLHKDKLCNKSGIYEQKEPEREENQTEIKMFKMTIKNSGDKEHY